MIAKLLLLSIFTWSSFAVVFLDIEITHEKGLDEKMILKSELMSRERADNNKEIFLQMKNGIQLRLAPIFSESEDGGVVDNIIRLSGIIQDVSSSKKEPKKFKLNIKVDFPGETSFDNGKGQKTKVKITPRVK